MRASTRSASWQPRRSAAGWTWTPICREVQFGLPVRRSLLLGVKEAINNAAKYSGATELFLRIHRRGNQLVVSVEDNGTGFDLELVDPERNGLTNMTERMKEIGGRCRIITRAGAGCQVEFQVPLPRQVRLIRFVGSGDLPMAADACHIATRWKGDAPPR